MSDYYQRHIELLEAVNAATTEQEHHDAEVFLRGFRDAIVTVGIFPHTGYLVMQGDSHYINQGVDHPMTGGIFHDWIKQ